MPAYGGNLAVRRTPWWAMKPSPLMRGIASLDADAAAMDWTAFYRRIWSSPQTTSPAPTGNTSAYMEAVMAGNIAQDPAQAAITAQQFRQGRPIGNGNYAPVTPPPGWDSSGHYTPPVGTRGDSTVVPPPPSSSSTDANQNIPPKSQPGDVPMNTGGSSTGDKLQQQADGGGGGGGSTAPGSSMMPLVIGAVIIGGVYFMSQGKKK